MSIDAGTIAGDFRQHFGSDCRIYRAPGRVNIIGGHSDYNEGFVLPTTTSRYTWVGAKRRDDRVVRVRSANFDEVTTFDLDDILRSNANHWSDYVKGVAQVLLQDRQLDWGADLLIDGALPLGGGLSSSASLEVAVAYALLDCGGQEINRRRLALQCQRAEVEFVGARCGVMDQYAISCGSHGHGTLLDCRSIQHRSIPLPDTLRLIAVDTGVKHQLVEGGLNARRAECEQAVKLLSKNLPGIRALRDVSMKELETHRSLLDDLLYRRARHVVGENLRVKRAVAALEAGDTAELGRLISQSHTSLRDDYDVSCPEMESLISILNDSDGVLGARLVGAGFGGCSLSVVDPGKTDQVIASVVSRYGEILGREPWIHVITPTEPVMHIESSP